MTDINFLIERRHELIRLTDKEYKSQQEKELDLKELSDVSRRIDELTYSKLKNKKVYLTKKLDKETSLKEIKKIYDHNYEKEREFAQLYLDGYKKYVKRKNLARELKTQLDEVSRKQKSGQKLNRKDKDISEKVLGWRLED